jgi:tetratricopeptide (TPR) repeat protein
VTEEIINRLAVVTGLGVISRTSSSQYEGKTIAQIAHDLDVQYVLEGAIRCDRTGDVNRVRITPRLVRTSDATNVWAGNYDRNLSELFEVQADIAEQVVGAMLTALLPAESTAVALKPTENMEAYEKYLEGMEVRRTPGENPYPLFLRATELDPTFAAPYAEISLLFSTAYGAGMRVDAFNLLRTKQWLDRALELDADLPQTRYAEAYYYTCTHDYNRALASARLAKEGLPNQADIHYLMQWIRRSQGLFDEALIHIQDGLRLNPRDPNFIVARATVNEAIGDFGAAAADWQQVHSLWPMDVRPACRQSELQITWRGDPAAALRATEQLGNSYFFPRSVYRANALVYARDFDGALHALSAIDTLKFGGRYYQFGKRFFAPGFLAGRVNWLKGDRVVATARYDSARVHLEKSASFSPDGASTWSALAECYAGLGRKEDARRTARKGLDLCSPSIDAYMGQFRLIDLARVYVMTGDLDSALVAMEQTLPAFLTSHELELDPLYDPLRAMPRFNNLIAQRKKGEERQGD